MRTTYFASRNVWRYGTAKQCDRKGYKLMKPHIITRYKPTAENMLNSKQRMKKTIQFWRKITQGFFWVQEFYNQWSNSLQEPRTNFHVANKAWTSDGDVKIVAMCSSLIGSTNYTHLLTSYREYVQQREIILPNNFPTTYVHRKSGYYGNLMRWNRIMA